MEMAASLAAENSYRNSARFLKEMLNVSLSHESIRQVKVNRSTDDRLVILNFLS